MNVRQIASVACSSTWANPSKPIVRNGVADVDCGQVTVTPRVSRGRGLAFRLLPGRGLHQLAQHNHKPMPQTARSSVRHPWDLSSTAPKPGEIAVVHY
ncbi:MAG: hypothetical protein QOE74_6028 [Mycobacterium sp.]|jgi:hypothetical protein|nr:hypothetical protein [Mycobacterium sp.]